MLGQGVLEGLASSGILELARQRHYLMALAHSVLHGREEARISFATLLQVRRGEKYLLIRNYHRPELFAPIGGVNKYYDEANHFLNCLLFRPQVIASEMDCDMRGFLPMKHLPKLIRWYNRRDNCESAEACLARELAEELKEMDVKQLSRPTAMAFVRLHQIVEGPTRVPGPDYRQLRLFDVCEIRQNSQDVSAFIEQLFEHGRNHPNLRIASSDEITRGRTADSACIGSVSEYLFRQHRVRPEGPAFVELDSTSSQPPKTEVT